MKEIIRSKVNRDLEPVIEVELLFNGQPQTFRFVIDTGFTGTLMIPSAIAAQFPVDGQERFLAIEDTEFHYTSPKIALAG